MLQKLKKRFVVIKSNRYLTDDDRQLELDVLLDDALDYLSNLNLIQILFNLKKIVALIKEIVRLFK